MPARGRYDVVNIAFVDQSWSVNALCAQTDPEEFFPARGGSTKASKRVCVKCDVRPSCLLWALDTDERWGVWGGLSEPERRKLPGTHPCSFLGCSRTFSTLRGAAAHLVHSHRDVALAASTRTDLETLP